MIFEDEGNRLFEESKVEFEILSEKVGKQKAFKILIYSKVKEAYTVRTGLKFNKNDANKYDIA